MARCGRNDKLITRCIQHSRARPVISINPEIKGKVDHAKQKAYHPVNRHNTGKVRKTFSCFDQG